MAPTFPKESLYPSIVEKISDVEDKIPYHDWIEPRLSWLPGKGFDHYEVGKSSISYYYYISIGSTEFKDTAIPDGTKVKIKAFQDSK